jgi:GNAT superfamily N-acetyltransferase
MHILERDPDSDPAPFWFVAVDAEMAWVYAVGVRPAWRRHGIALALLRHSFGALYQGDKRTASLEANVE